jgi:hypothetical protein
MSEKSLPSRKQNYLFQPTVLLCDTFGFRRDVVEASTALHATRRKLADDNQLPKPVSPNI